MNVSIVDSGVTPYSGVTFGSTKQACKIPQIIEKMTSGGLWNEGKYIEHRFGPINWATHIGKGEQYADADYKPVPHNIGLSKETEQYLRALRVNWATHINSSK